MSTFDAIMQIMRDVLPPHLLTDLTAVEDLQRAKLKMEEEAKAQSRLERRAMKREVFTIYQVDNGFMGQVGSSIVVGLTLSEVCAAAQAQAATQRVLEEDAPTTLADGETLGSKTWLKLG